MAALQSLGSYIPTGLEYLVREEILPPSPPQDSYAWATYIDAAELYGEEEILYTNDCVIWSQGGVIKRVLRFTVKDQRVSQALLTSFRYASCLASEHSRDGLATQSLPKPQTAQNDRDASHPAPNETICLDDADRALVVLLNDELHVYSVAGTTHVLNLPFEVHRALPTSSGLLLQRKISDPVNVIRTISPRVPSAPPNSFIFSQLHSPRKSYQENWLPASPVSRRDHHGLVQGLEDLTAGSIQAVDSAPTLFAVIDPLSGFGLVTETDHIYGGRSLDQEEEILYSSTKPEVKGSSGFQDSLSVVVSVNSKRRSYNIWSIDAARESQLIKSRSNTFDGGPDGQKEVKARVVSGVSTPTTLGRSVRNNHRRSSYRKSFPASGSIQQTARPAPRISESFSRDELATEDIVSTLGGGPDYSSQNPNNRRVSSFIARSELNYHDQTAHIDQTRPISQIPPTSGNLSRQGPLSSSFSERRSFGKARLSGRASTPGSVTRLSAVDEHTFPSLDDDATLEDFDTPRGNHRLRSSDEPRSSRDAVLSMHRIASTPMQTPHAFNQSWSSWAFTDFKLVTVVNGPVSQKHSITILILHRPSHSVTELTLLFSRQSNDYQTITGSDNRSAKQDQGYWTLTEPCKIRYIKDVLEVGKVQGRKAEEAILWGAVGSDLYLLRSNFQADALAYGRQSQEWQGLGALPGCIRLDNTLFDTLGLDRSSESDEPRIDTCTRGQVLVTHTHGRISRVMLTLDPRHSHISTTLNFCDGIVADHIGQPAQISSLWRTDFCEESEKNMFLGEWKSLLVALFAFALDLLTTPTERAALADRLSLSPTKMSSGDKSYISEISGMNSNLWNRLRLTSTQRSNATSVISVIECIHKALSLLNSSSFIGRQSLNAQGANRPNRELVTKLMLLLHLKREELKLEIVAATSGLTHADYLALVIAQYGHWLAIEEWSSVDGGFLHNDSDAVRKTTFDMGTFKSSVNVRSVEHPTSVFQELRLILEQGQYTRTHGFAPHSLGYLFSQGPKTEYPYLISKYCPMLVATARVMQWLLQSANKSPSVPGEIAKNITDSNILETLPEALAVMIRASIEHRQAMPPTDWSPALLRLVSRDDLNQTFDEESPADQFIERGQQTSDAVSKNDVRAICEETWSNRDDETSEKRRQKTEKDVHEKMLASFEEADAIAYMIYRSDKRFMEASRLLNPLRIAIAELKPVPGASESSFLEQQKLHAQEIYERTQAIPAGEGIIHLSKLSPLPTEKLSMPAFNTSCRIVPSNVIFNADRGTEEKVGWAYFHVGVSVGLRVSRTAKNIDTSWLVLNKPVELGNRHAGFLLGLGLNGHLRSIAKWLFFKYLTTKHNMTCIGLLLGMAASHLGTMDTLVTRILSVHILRLLPPGAAELNLSPLSQTASMLGIGLLFYNTQHRRMSEVMLSELEYFDTEEQYSATESFRNEGYRLAVGFALGLINLGHGKNLKSLRDLRVLERLLTIARGPREINAVHILDQAAAGATVALTLIYMKTDEASVAAKIDVPDTAQQFDYVRSDILLLRTVAKNIIMWSKIEPTNSWIWRSLPESYRAACSPDTLLKIDTPFSSYNLPYYNILGGICWSIALRLSGTGSVIARDCLLKHYDSMTEFINGAANTEPTFDHALTRDTLRRIQHLLALSLATVMAGTGDVDVLQRLRVLYATINSDSTFGLHQAACTAMGVLFMGQGRYSLTSSNLAVASLLCAFYPIFPKDISDNRAHLQAFRHLWTFAAEPRYIVPRDIDTREPVVVPVTVTLTNGLERRLLAPALLPELASVASVAVVSPEYWPVALDFARQPAHLAAFRTHQTIFLRRKSLLAQHVTPFAATLAGRAALGRNARRTASPFEVFLAQPLFEIVGMNVAGGWDVLPRGQSIDVAEFRRTVSSDADEDGGGFIDEIPPPVTALVDSRTTGLDDLLVLLRDVAGEDRAALTALRLLLDWGERCRLAGESIGWIRDGGFDALKAAVMRRLQEEVENGAPRETGSEAMELDE